ncbi:hypothetical protein [Nocardioides marinquilinus]|uniref:hypothetical protein n=1 Tax=Nocardioides marinquilinus TaxID=1210400 RepID=UPI0031EAF65D
MPVPRPASRRLVLGSALAGVAGTTACSLDSLDPSPDDPTYTPTTSPTGEGSDEVDPDDPTEPAEPSADEALTLRVRRAVARTEATTAAAVRRHPALAGDLGPLTDLHRAHLRELGGPVRGAAAPEPPGGRRAARAGAVRAEARLQRTLLAAATEAESGPLALLLATMAASVAQHREVL